MSIFKRNKSEINKSSNDVKAPCSCNGQCNGNSDKLSIKILGSGCAKCNQLESSTKEALNQLGITASIEHITDFSKIASYGVMSTPALVVNNKVVSSGKVLKPQDIIKLLK